MKLDVDVLDERARLQHSKQGFLSVCDMLSGSNISTTGHFCPQAPSFSQNKRRTTLRHGREGGQRHQRLRLPGVERRERVIRHGLQGVGWGGLKVSRLVDASRGRFRVRRGRADV